MAQPDASVSHSPSHHTTTKTHHFLTQVVDPIPTHSATPKVEPTLLARCLNPKLCCAASPRLHAARPKQRPDGSQRPGASLHGGQRLSAVAGPDRQRRTASLHGGTTRQQWRSASRRNGPTAFRVRLCAPILPTTYSSILDLNAPSTQGYVRLRFCRHALYD